MSQNFSSAAVVIGALRVKFFSNYTVADPEFRSNAPLRHNYFIFMENFLKNQEKNNLVK